MTQQSEQLDFDFNAPADDGYETWMWNRQQATARIAKTYGLPIGKKVRLKLYNIDGDFTGKLQLKQIPLTINPGTPLELKLDKMTFQNTEIEHCVAISN